MNILLHCNPHSAIGNLKAAAGPLCLLVLLSSTGEAAPLHVRVMSYNIGCGTYADLSPSGVGRLADEIIDNRVDIAALTEVDVGTDWYGGRDLVAEVKQRLAARGYAMHDFQSEIVKYHGGKQVHALLSRWPILAAESPHYHAKRGWRVDRIEVEPVPGLRVACFHTHIPPGVDNLVEGMARMGAWIGASSIPAFACGDFNLPYGSPHLRPLEDAGFRHASTLAHGGPTPSVGVGAAVVGGLPLEGQIDHIYVSPAVRVVRAYTHYTTISDHWPVVAELALDAPPGAAGGENVRVPAPPMEWDGAMDAWRRGNLAAAIAACDAPGAEAQGETKAFAAYSAACWHQLLGDTARAEQLFRTVAGEHPDSCWGVRSLQRLALWLAECRRSADAAEAEERFLAGYYDVIHPYPLDNTLPGALPRIAADLQAAGRPVPGRRETLEALAEKYAGRGLGRAAHYFLSVPLLEARKYEAWHRHFKAAQVDIGTLFNRTEWQIEILRALTAVGDFDTADLLIRRRLGPAIPSPEVRRNIFAPYWKRRFPHVYDLALRPGETRTLALAGERHAAAADGGPSPLIGTLALSVADGSLRLRVTVTDLLHVNNRRGDALWQGDSLQIAVDPGREGGDKYDANDIELGVALSGGGAEIHVWRRGALSDPAALRANVSRDRSDTIYDVTLPLAALGLPDAANPAFGLNVVVNDHNADGRAGRLEWAPGMATVKEPGLFPIVRIAGP